MIIRLKGTVMDSMAMNWKAWILSAAVLGATGVALGAYQAHGLEKMLEGRGLEPARIDERMDQCETAVRYQMTHALALLGLGLLTLRLGAGTQGKGRFRVAGGLFLVGTILFSGGLYLIVFAENSIHWAIIPLGGVCLILGWVAMGVEVLFCRLKPDIQ